MSLLFHAVISVEFTELPRVEKYGIVVVFKDLYGTKWDLEQLD